MNAGCCDVVSVFAHLSLFCALLLSTIFVTKNLKGFFILVFIFIMVNVCVVLLPRLRTDSLIGAIDDVIF